MISPSSGLVITFGYRRRLMSGPALPALAFALALVGAGSTQAQGVMPSGGQVVAGRATISSAGAGSPLVVTQSSGKAIIDWSDFSIGAGGAVRFDNGAGATLNRVTGGGVSSLDGRLSASGSVYLINPNGVIIGKTGVVDVGGGFIASTLDVDNGRFMAGGDLIFTGDSLASVTNLGRIGALGGDVALLATTVRNDGAITAANGAAGLIAGRSILMRDAARDGGKFLVRVGASTDSATNGGAIAAATAELRAEGGSVYALAGNTEGVVRATGVSAQDGKIYLTAGQGGSVTVAGGRIVATKASGDGGDIFLSGGTMMVASGAVLDASATGTRGEGGSILAIADMTDGALSFQGQALAKGGASGGDGGFIETSGARVDFTGGRFDATAALGATGTWLVDPYNLTIDSAAAATINSNLASVNVTLRTTDSGVSGPGAVSAGAGDIVINSALNWSGNTVLTLDAYNAITVNADITVGGAGGVTLLTNSGGAGGDLTFAAGKSLSFTGGAGSLSINGGDYTLLHSWSEVMSANAGGRNALALSVDASGSPLTSAVFASYSGTFEGLGHTIDALTITAAAAGNLGLFGSLSGTVRDLGLTNAALTGFSSGDDDGGGCCGPASTQGVFAGKLGSAGLLQNVYSTGTVSAESGNTGGLVGTSQGVVINAWSSVNLTSASGANVGGLLGSNGGTLSRSHATGSASSPVGSGYAGGAVAINYGTISEVYATGAVDGGTLGGGLVGSGGGTVSNSYATGAVTGGYYAGGLYGIAQGANLTDVYATGSVTSGTTRDAGGLVGYAEHSTITNAYATGAVGVAGLTYGVGGLLGTDFLNQNTVINGYYDSQTTGMSDTGKGVGLTTAQLQGALPSGFGAGWATGDGLYPYLTAFGVIAPDQVVSGLAYNRDGSLVTLGGTVGVYSAGSLLSGSAASIGANGYYYVILPSGTVAGGTGLGATLTLGGSSAVSGATYTDAPTFTGLDVTGLDVWDGQFRINTASTRYSDLAGGLSATFGAGAYAATLADLNTTWFNITAANAFTLDAAPSTTGSLSITTGGDLTIAANLTVDDGERLDLEAGRSLRVDADITAQGSAGVTLATNVDGGTGGDHGFTSGHALSFTGLASSGPSLTINGDSYALLYSMDDLAAISGQSGKFALATSLQAGGTPYTTAVVDHLSAGAVFEGLGHTIRNLTIVGGDNPFIGLFAFNRGTIRDIGLVNGEVSGSQYVGALVGYNDQGTIRNAYALTRVSATSYYAGGLVGYTDGTIANAYSTGSVSGLGLVGGLAGFVVGGVVSNVYATGAVSGTERVGGLIGGLESGVLDGGFATGAVTGVSSSHGLIGAANGTVANAYYDSDTSGQTDPRATGLTTAQLQSGVAPTGFSAGAWSGGAGLYPYLSTFGVVTLDQIVSGVAYNADGSRASGGTVGVYATGALLGGTTVSTGANGYYYVTLPTGTVTPGAAVGATLTLGGSSAVGGATYTDAPTFWGADISGLDLTAGQFVIKTHSSSYSALRAAMATTFGSTLASALNADLDLAALKIRAGSGFLVDELVSRNGAILIQADGDLTLDGAGALSSTATGDAITLAANGSFINTSSAGPQAVTAANGRWLVYTQATGGPTLAATADVRGGLVGSSYYGDVYDFGTGTFATSVNAGNRFVTGYRPTLTLTADSQSVVYDGAAQTTTYGLSGYLNIGDQAADTITGSASGLTTSSRNVGNYVLTGTGGTLASDQNYALTYASGTLTITPAVLAASLTGTTTKTYDGLTTASLTSSNYMLSGAVLNDDVGLNGPASGLYADRNAGSGKTVTASGLTLAGADAGNYTVNGSASAAIGAITPASLVASLTGATTKTYDGLTTATLTSGNYALSGAVLNDDVALNDPASGLYADKNAGSGKTVTASGLTLLGLDAGNYTVNGSASAAIGAITPASLLASLTGATTKTYDGLTTASLTSSNYMLSGAVLNDDVGLSGPTSGLYADKNAGSGKTVTASGLTLSGLDAGNYTVNGSASAAIGAITPASLVASLTGATTKTYDGLTTATLTSGNYALSGAVLNDDVALNAPTSGLYADKNAGSGKIVTANGLTLSGDDAGNYTVNGSASAAIGAITQRGLTLSATSGGKVFGAVDALGYTISLGSLVDGDSVTGMVSRESGEAVGQYAITQGTLAASPDYAVTFLPAVYTIAPNPITPMQNASGISPLITVSSPAPASPTSTLTSDSGRAQGATTTQGRADASGSNGVLVDCTGGDCANSPYPGAQASSPFITFANR